METLNKHYRRRSLLTCHHFNRKYGVAPGVAAESEWLDAVAAHEVGGQGLHGEGEVARGGVGGGVEEAERELVDHRRALPWMMTMERWLQHCVTAGICRNWWTVR